MCLYHIDENLLNIAAQELFEEIRKQKNQREPDIEFDNGYFKQEEGFKNKKLPNICHVIVKNRGGRLKDIRIFSHLNLGTIREEVICVTDQDLNPLNQTIQIANIVVPSVANVDEWLGWLNG